MALREEVFAITLGYTGLAYSTIPEEHDLSINHFLLGGSCPAEEIRSPCAYRSHVLLDCYIIFSALFLLGASRAASAPSTTIPIFIIRLHYL
jgi:hypothetical protein